MSEVLLAFDIGTSAMKASMFDVEGHLINEYSYPYETVFLPDGGAEQDPEDWWKGIVDVSGKMAQTNDQYHIAAISFSGQESGLVLVDQSGHVLRHSMIHCDMRAREENNYILSKIDEDEIFKITGHVSSPSYSLAKLLWVKVHQPEIYRQTWKVLNAKDYIVFRLTGRFITDHTDASFTGIYDITERRWSEKLLNVCGIDMEKMPEIYPSTYKAGETNQEFEELTGIRKGVPVIIGAGDGQCASVGCGAVKPGQIYNSLGTSSWITVILKTPPLDCEKCLETAAHPAGDYANSGGTMQTAGTSRDWAVNQLYHQESPDVISQELEGTVPGANNVIFLPYLNGERVPWWDSNARGVFIGISTLTTRADMLRAVLEGIALNLKTILDAAKKYENVEQMIAFGGLAKDKVFCQILADVYEIPVVTLKHPGQITSLGAAIIGGVGSGIYPDFSVAETLTRKECIYYPDKANQELYRKRLSMFKEAYSDLKDLFSEMAFSRK